MHKIPSQASHCENTSMSSCRSKDVTSFSGGNAKELILKGRNEMGQSKFSGKIQN